jgi:uncharacterized protein (TIGR02145 family)
MSNIIKLNTTIVRSDASVRVANQLMASNKIKAVTIGPQVWMIENLNVSNYRNGTPIPEVKNYDEWVRYGNEKIGCWCYYDNDENNGAKYGKLYNWHAVNDQRGLAPEGWHVPTKKEFEELIGFLGGEHSAGEKMMSKAGWKDCWLFDDCVGTNESGWNGLAGGYCYRNDGIFTAGLEEYGHWWSTSESGTSHICHCLLYCSSGSHSVIVHKSSSMAGFSVRCIKNRSEGRA